MTGWPAVYAAETKVLKSLRKQCVKKYLLSNSWPLSFELEIFSGTYNNFKKSSLRLRLQLEEDTQASFVSLVYIENI